MTAEELYAAIGSNEENDRLYYAWREAKIAEVAEYLTEHCVETLSDRAVAMAEGYMEQAEESRRIYGNGIAGEIPARHSKTGNPVSFEI